MCYQNMFEEITPSAWVLIAFSFFCTFGVSVVFPYIPVHAQEIGIPLALIGNLVVVYYLLQAFARVPLGKLSDKLDYHRPVFIGSVCFVLSAIAFLASSQWWFLLFVGEFFLGLANSITWVTIPSFITNVPRAISVQTFALGVGWALGSPIGGYIKDAVGIEGVFSTLLVASILLCILSFLFYHYQSESQTFPRSVLYFFGKEWSLPMSLPLYPALSSYAEAWNLFKVNLELMYAALFSFLVFMTFGLGSSIVPLYFTEVGLSAFLIGILISLRTVTSTTIRLLYSRIVTRLGDRPTLGFATFFVGICMIALANTESTALLTLFSGMWGLSSGLYLPVVFNVIRKNTSKNERGLAMGIRGTLGTFGAAFGTWAFSGLAGFFSLSIALTLAGITAALGSILLSLFSSRMTGVGDSTGDVKK